MSPAAGTGPRLPIRLEPQWGESLRGFILRLSDANGYADPDWLLCLSRLPRTFATTPCNLRPLSTLAGVAKNEIERMACWPIGRNQTKLRVGAGWISGRNVDLSHPRVCVACLEAKHGARQIWDIRLFIACPKHGRLLTDQCGVCGERLRWRRRSLALCQCGKPLKLGHLAFAEALSIARWIEALYEGSHAQPDNAASLETLEQLLGAAWVLGTMSPHSTQWRSRFIAKPGISTLSGIVTDAAAVLCDWPNGLDRWLAKHRLPALAEERAAGIGTSFGSVLRRVRRALPEADYPFLYDALRHYFAHRWDGIVKPWSTFGAMSRSTPTYMTATAAARSLHVTPAAVVRMIQRDEVPGRSLLLGKRHQHILKSDDVSDLLAERRAALTSAKLGNELGISASQVEQLRLEEIIPARFRMRAGFLFARKDVERFIADLRQRATPCQCLPPLVSLSEIPKRHRARLSTLIVMIRAGQIKIFCSPSIKNDRPILKDLWVDSDVAESVVPIDGDGRSYINHRNAAKVLKLAQRMVPALLAAGCLTPGVSCAPSFRGITRASIELFQQRYRLSRDVAVIFGTSARGATRLLMSLGTQPVIPSNSARGISAVWRTDDVTSALTVLERSSTTKARESEITISVS